MICLETATEISEKLLTSALKVNASDIHFFPQTHKANIYFRIHGQRKHIKTIPISTYQLLLTYYKFTSGMDIGEIRKPQNGMISHQTSSMTYALRLSTLPLQSMESLAIRILPQWNHLSLEQLFLFPNQLKDIKRWMNYRAGIILITGPTGSGKSTTLYALLQAMLEKYPYQAITLEDPVEKNIHNLLQVQINEQAGVTYHTGLKAALRHDPDVMMIGEIRDKKTAHFAFDAALTGHLIFSTLHAKDAVGTIDRLLDMGLSRIDLKQSLVAIAALELLPIKINRVVKRRAAILEILNETSIQHILSGKKIPFKQKQTFDHLRKKAYAYGFISKKVLFNR